MLIRLQKFLSKAGVASRRKAERIILDGRVSVNEKAVTELGMKIDPEKDKVTVDAKNVSANVEKIYYLINKPAGYTTTVKDPHAEHTVLELIPKETRVFPVGRLDKDTTGLLILTNDGDITQRLTHPSHGKEKEYIVTCNNKLTIEGVRKLEGGVYLEDGLTMPSKIKTLEIGTNEFIYSITIKEGKKRQIRRMFEKIGNPVVKLKRIRMGNLTLGDLKEGEWRELTEYETNKLYGKKE